MASKTQKIGSDAIVNELAYRNLVGPNFLPLNKLRPGRMLRDNFKHEDELAVGRDFLGEIGLSDQSLRSGPDNLPPDLIYKCGNRLIAIENTSLGVGDAEIDSKKKYLGKLADNFRSTNSPDKKIKLEIEFIRTQGELSQLGFWTKEYFLSRLRETIFAKDSNQQLIKAIPEFEEAWLFVSLNGANLTKSYIDEYLAGQWFDSSVFAHIWIKLQYDPELKTHPIFKLALNSNAVDVLLKV